MQQLGRWAWYGYLFLWAWSIPLLAFDLVPPGTEWMGTVILVLAGGLSVWWLWMRYGNLGLLASLWVFVGSWAVEHLGVTSGWPFGRYTYNGVLQPELIGVVPLAIPCAWLMVVPGAWELARMLIPKRAYSAWLILGGATLATMLDIVIEPVAVHVNQYWTWLDGGPMAGVPISNFIAWWSLAAILSLGMWILIKQPQSQHAQEAWSLPSLLFLSTLILFSIVDLTHGYPLIGLFGLALLAASILRCREQLPQLQAALKLPATPAQPAPSKGKYPRST